MSVVINGTGSISGLSNVGGIASAQSGSVIQTVSAVFTATSSTTSSSFVATNVTTSITPLFSTSKVFITISVSADTQGSNQQAGFTIYRNSTNLGTGSANNSLGFAWDTAGRQISGVTMQYLDSPATTSSTTYTVYMNSQNTGSVQINNAAGATITLMEIAA